MKIAKIKTTSGPLTISIPSDLSEITIDVLMRLTPAYGDTFSPLEQLSILSGIPKEFNDKKPDVICLEDICNLDDLAVFDTTIELLAIKIKSFVTEQEIPESILVPVDTAITRGWRWFRGSRHHVGKLVPVIKNLGIQPAGAYFEAKEIIRQEFEEWAKVKKEYGDHIEFNPSIQSLCRVLSLYLYVPATGEKFNSARAADFDKVTKQLPITKALPIARYFFLRYPNLSKPKAPPFRDQLQRYRSKQV